jgi:hypothetical protein
MKAAVLVVLVACAQPAYVRAPVYAPWPEPPPPSLPAAQAREREAFETSFEVTDFEAVVEESCILLRMMDAGSLPEECE